VRISCGVATGADGVFLQRAKEIDADLERFAYPTIAGRELRPGNRDVQTSWYLLTPYDRRGALLPEHELGPFRDFLCRSDRRKRLEARTCTPRKPWYAFHETPPLADLLRPKILCKDIAAEPDFWLDDAGSIVPRHSVYYIVPKDAARMDSIVGYLRSAKARKWLIAHCQRAANGFMRMQSSVLKEMPIPSELVPEREQTLIENLDEATAKTG
jgi:hypothetical protein